MSLTLYQRPGLVDILQVCYTARDDEREQYEAFMGEKYDPETFASRLHLTPGPRWSICDETGPVVVAGFDFIRPGVYQDWMVSCERAWSPANWKGVTRFARKVMNAMLKHEAHRLQCISLRSRIDAHRWYKVLGLRQEGVLESYGTDGQDAIIFSRIRPNG